MESKTFLTPAQWFNIDKKNHFWIDTRFEFNLDSFPDIIRLKNVLQWSLESGNRKGIQRILGSTLRYVIHSFCHFGAGVFP